MRLSGGEATKRVFVSLKVHSSLECSRSGLLVRGVARVASGFNIGEPAFTARFHWC